MKIKEGEYIRTKQGYIAKVEDVGENIIMCDSDIYSDYEIAPVLVGEQMKLITKHSFNIIDLIEANDYVNGMKVIATENRGRYNEEKQKDEKVILAENYDEWTENGVISNEDIKNIVTKEQFNSVMYKVVE